MTDEHPSRRDFVRALCVGGAATLALPALPASLSALARRHDVRGGTVDGWDRVPGILARIIPPTFPARDFLITKYGARGDGTTDCSAAFAQAIAACAAAGGGRVVAPAGRFLTGPIHLRSNVNLHVEAGGTIMFVRDPARYLPAVFTRFEGMELMGYSPFIYAFGQDNIAITGLGTLDGQAGDANWWPWKGSKDHGYAAGNPTQAAAREKLAQLTEAGVPVSQRVFADGSYLRPQFIQPYRCRNVLIEDVTIVNSPMWEIHPVLCTNVTVRRVKINSHGPNNDGCDPESCKDVLIEQCMFDTGDDCIAIKSGRNADGRRLAAPTENVIVRNCTMKDGHGGVTIGSEISGDVRYVFAERCLMDSPNLDRALRLKNNASRGGVLEHIYMRDITVGQVADAVISIDFTYEEGSKGAFTPVARDINVERVSSRKSKYGVYLKGFPNAPITDVHLTDCQFHDVANGNVAENVKNVTYDHVSINGKPV